MPYIKSKDRLRVEDTLLPLNTGELNYLVSISLLNRIKNEGKNYENLSITLNLLDEAIELAKQDRVEKGVCSHVLVYELIIETTYLDKVQVLRALKDAKLEFYRRVVAPYEDLKIKENGDVYEEIL